MGQLKDRKPVRTGNVKKDNGRISWNKKIRAGEGRETRKIGDGEKKIGRWRRTGQKENNKIKDSRRSAEKEEKGRRKRRRRRKMRKGKRERRKKRNPCEREKERRSQEGRDQKDEGQKTKGKEGDAQERRKDAECATNERGGRNTTGIKQR